MDYFRCCLFLVHFHYYSWFFLISVFIICLFDCLFDCLFVYYLFVCFAAFLSCCSYSICFNSCGVWPYLICIEGKTMFIFFFPTKQNWTMWLIVNLRFWHIRRTLLFSAFESYRAKTVTFLSSISNTIDNLCSNKWLCRNFANRFQPQMLKRQKEQTFDCVIV